MAVSFCLCSLHVLHPLLQLPHLPQLSPPLIWQPQLFLPVLAGICQHPTCPIPATLASKPKLFPTPKSIIQLYLNLNSEDTTSSPPRPSPSIDLHPNQILRCTQDPNSSFQSTLLTVNSFLPVNASFLPRYSLYLISIKTSLPAFPMVYSYIFFSAQTVPHLSSPWQNPPEHTTSQQTTLAGQC